MEIADHDDDDVVVAASFLYFFRVMHYVVRYCYSKSFARPSQFVNIKLTMAGVSDIFLCAL